MATVQDQDIRAALQAALATAAGENVELVYEGFYPDGAPYRPRIDQPFIEVSLTYTEGRPRTIGDNPLVYHSGEMIANLVYPVGRGTADLDTMASTVKRAFANDVPVGDVLVRISYAERRGRMVPDGDWMRLPIFVGWYVYTDQN